MRYVLYIHGMGGGGDSRIPSILNEYFSSQGAEIKVIVRTYDFDPELAQKQIAGWVDEFAPRVVVGESLGALHAMKIKEFPVLLVSPALNAPVFFEVLAWLVLIPGVAYIFDRIYRPKDGDRQKMHFTFRVLRKYLPHRKSALSASEGSDIHAFFGTADHYRRSGVVSIRTWKRYFGNAYTMYDGTHFMEDEYVRGLLAAKLSALCQEVV